MAKSSLARQKLKISYMFFSILSSADLFQNQVFRKNIAGIPSECHTIWIQIRPDILLSLIWLQTVRKGYPQMTSVSACRQRVKKSYVVFICSLSCTVTGNML